MGFHRRRWVGSPGSMAARGLLAVLWLSGCSGGQSTSGTGGAADLGGNAGATSSTGGTASSGGALATGGSVVSGGGTRASGGMVASGGTLASGGSSTSSGGVAANGGGDGGKVATGGTSSSGGSAATGGRGATGGSGTPGSGGASARGGAAGSSTISSSGGVGALGGSNGSGGAGGAISTGTGACGSATLNQHPFGCKFGWGMAAPSGSLANYSYVQFMSYWVDSSISAAGTYTTCGACNWLKNQVASTNIIPAYYAYIIGFLAHANGIVDGNQTGSKKLTTDGAALVKANRAAIVSAYGWYAQQTAKVWPTKPLVWLLEGDFVQLVASSQSSPMTYPEIGQLAADITCAIKANMPNAVVAIDQSSWNDNNTTNSYWAAMAKANYDMAWTTGVGNNNGFIEGSATSATYNAATATYAYLHKLTGRTILVDTSAGISAAGDSWSTASLADLNARISEGVIAANITGTAPSQSNIASEAGVNALPTCP